MNKKIEKSVLVEGREWFDKSGGNSYFSARIWVDGEIVGVLPFQYGYGDQYLYIAQEWLTEEGYLSEEMRNRALWSIAREAGFDFYYSKTYTKKSEMFTPLTHKKVSA